MGERTRQKRIGAAGIVTLAVVVLAGGQAFAQQGAPANGEWPTCGGDLGTKYSPLDQIDRTNFGDLEIAGRWLSADAFVAAAASASETARAACRLLPRSDRRTLPPSDRRQSLSFMMLAC